MKKPKNDISPAAKLRQSAEERMRASGSDLHIPFADIDATRLVHELQVHQIELETQNEELARARAESEAALEKYADLYDFAPVGYLTLGKSGAIRSVNFLGASLLGSDRSLLIGHPLATFLTEASRPILAGFLKQVFSDGVGATCDVAISADRNSLRNVRITASIATAEQECRMVIVDITQFKGEEAQLKNAFANLQKVVTERTADLAEANIRLTQDIAERRRTAAALQESEEHYRRLLSSITDYVFHVEIVSGQAVRTQHGEGCEAVTGYTPDDYVNAASLWIAMVPFEDRPTVTQAMSRILTSNVPITFEHRIVHKDGRIRWIRNILVPHRDASGTLISYDGVIADITERKHHEQERHRLELEARQGEKLKALGQLAAGVAHEVRSPLNAIIVTAELLAEHLQQKPECRAYLDRIRRQVARLNNLMKDLLELRRPADARNRQQLPAAGLCRMAVEIWRQSCKETPRQLVINCTPEADGVRIFVDPDRMVQVVVNILDNAAQQSGAGAEIAVSIVGPASGHICIQILDRGPGVSEKGLRHAFDPCFSTRKGGSGLGLSIVKHIIETYLGQVTIENNNPPPGCTVTVRLPIAEDMPADA